MQFNYITLFPELFEPHINTYPLRKAVENNIASYNTTNLRDFAVDNRGSVDARTYGGGVGMLLRPEPVFEAVESIERAPNSKIILLSPKGKKFTQAKAKEFAKLDQLILISGRYEGVDARIEEHLVDEVISIGNYVLAGGELGAMVIAEAITRLLPGILEKEGAAEIESFENNTLEYPQYTRPEEYKGHKVPEVLLSGHHAEIEKWREENLTKLKSPNKNNFDC